MATMQTATREKASPNRVLEALEAAKTIQANISKYGQDNQDDALTTIAAQMRALVARIAILPDEPEPVKAIAAKLVSTEPPKRRPQKTTIDLLGANIDALLTAQAAKGDGITPFEIRALLRLFYTIQKVRIQANNRAKALEREGMPNDYLLEFVASHEAQEAAIINVMQHYNKTHPMSTWLGSIKGIGPILTAGFVTIFDITKAPTAGHFWSYAGLTPNSIRRRGEPCNYNPLAKVLCFKAAMSFALTAGKKLEDGTIDTTNASYYGKLYRLRREYENAHNTPEHHAEYCKLTLASKNYERDTIAKKCYLEGIFPPAHIDMRARRWTARMFLAHLHEVWFEEFYKQPAPIPYAQKYLDHVHVIKPPYLHYDPQGIIMAPTPLRTPKGKVVKQ